MKIYSFPTFNLTKILYTAEELGQEYELEILDATKLEHKTPEHLERHPAGKVPVLEHNGKFYFESNNLCRLIAELNDNKLYGDTPEQRAEVNQWIDYMGYQVSRWMMFYAWEEGVKPNYLGQDPDPTKTQEAHTNLGQQLPLIEQQLAKNTYFAGNDISIADTVAFALCQIQSFTSLDLTGYQNISRWYETMAERPSINKALDRLPGRGIFTFLAEK